MAQCELRMCEALHGTVQVLKCHDLAKLHQLCQPASITAAFSSCRGLVRAACSRFLSTLLGFLMPRFFSASMRASAAAADLSRCATTSSSLAGLDSSSSKGFDCSDSSPRIVCPAFGKQHGH